MASNTKSNSGFTEEERKAMMDRSRELALEKRVDKKRASGEEEILKAIEGMKGDDKEMATKIHRVVSEAAPELWPKTWYGMPAYAKDGKTVVCFFQPAGKFKARYSTFGFNDEAKLDHGNMWPTSFALTKLGDSEEKQIAELVRRALDSE